MTKPLTPKEIRSDYEVNTGHAIVRRFAKLDPLHMPGVLVAGHAPFCWGASPTEAAHAAVVIEEIAATGDHDDHRQSEGPGDLQASARQALPSQARQHRVLRTEEVED